MTPGEHRYHRWILRYPWRQADYQDSFAFWYYAFRPECNCEYDIEIKLAEETRRCWEAVKHDVR